MEDMWGIRKVLEIQGNTYSKVEVQANSESRSLILSSTQSPGPPCLKIDVHDVSVSDLGDLYMLGKLWR
jgi:hypothetical protein